MYRIGIDVGSTFTKYCIAQDGQILSLQTEKTRLHQREYFPERLKELRGQYPDAEIVACGYGRNNVGGIRNISELAALAKGSWFVTGQDGAVLDIGGQDTKIIAQQKGRIREFFTNEKCAAGCGMFLSGVLDLISFPFDRIDLTEEPDPSVKLSAACAVFAQSEIVGLIADNRSEKDIIGAVLWQILTSAKPLVGKIGADRLLLSGGLSSIKGFSAFAEKIFQKECAAVPHGPYLSAIGCAVL